jgi:hypothetical protein
MVEHWSTDRLPGIETIRERLGRVFPEGLDRRESVVGDRAARCVYVFLYVLAVEGVTEHRVRPAMITRMTDEQAARTAVSERTAWWERSRASGAPRDVPGR